MAFAALSDYRACHQLVLRDRRAGLVRDSKSGRAAIRHLYRPVSSVSAHQPAHQFHWLQLRYDRTPEASRAVATIPVPDSGYFPADLRRANASAAQYLGGRI